MKENPRLTPDEILKIIQKDDAKSKFGQLTIFFGMSAGVGKTYAMLENAQQLLKAGIDVVIGTINTHGRAETELLLKNLPILPKKWLKYKDTAFEELDLDALLSLKPKIVLIDELAHTNVPGSKHSKRWQDVEELLDAGIDVYTTLNVQHVESRKDIIEKITSIIIRETVPDLIVERASTITLIDIPPSSLLQRLREGKVYIAKQSQLAVENFFKEDNLTALREIALRFTAEKVDHDLHGMSVSGKSWKTRERLMVMIDHKTATEQLIRSTRRLAFELDAPWIVLYVNSGIKLNVQEQAKLNKYLQLAQELGADIVSIDDLDPVNALQRIAKEKEITRLLIARQERSSLFQNPFKLNLIDRLQKSSKNFDIIIVRQDSTTAIYKKVFEEPLEAGWRSYAIAAFLIFLVGALAIFALPYVGYPLIGLAFLITLLPISAFLGIGPFFLSAFLSAVIWKFILDYFHKNGAQESKILFLLYFLVVLLLGSLLHYVWKREQFYKKREKKTLLLYEIMREITKSTSFNALREYTVKKLKTLFAGDFTLLRQNEHKKLNFSESDMKLLTNEKEQAAAYWALSNKKIAGCMTDTLSSADALFFPIQFANEPVGLLVYAPQKRSLLNLEEIHFLQSVAEQLGIYVEKFSENFDLKIEPFTVQLEKTQRAIVRSITNELYDPVEKILENVVLLNKSLNLEAITSDQTLINTINLSCKKMKISIDNLMITAQIESGIVKIDKKPHLIKDFIEQIQEEVSYLTQNGRVKVNFDISNKLATFNFDWNLMKIALINLLLNVMQYSTSKNIHLEVQSYNSTIKFSVIDEGNSLPVDELSLIFESFYHFSSLSERGIDLNVVRAVANIHNGYLEIKEKNNQVISSIVLRD